MQKSRALKKGELNLSLFEEAKLRLKECEYNVDVLL
jgi:hypothetical protein